MTYEYDKVVDGLYIWFLSEAEESMKNYAGEIWPTELKNEIGLLFDDKGKLMGLEIMPASKFFDEKKLDKLCEDSYK